MDLNRQIPFTQIGYVYLPTTDIQASIDWYVCNFRLKLIDTFTDRGSLIAILHYPHKHAIALVLIQTDQHQPLQILRNGTKFPIMAINCPDIAETHKLLSANGVAVGELITLGNGEAKYFYFEDNQGNLLEAAWSMWDAKDDLKQKFYQE